MNTKNLSKSKEETARLSEENKLMEIRLQELKLAMDKEKKARSAQSQGYWQSAQDNKSAVNHSPEVLKKNMRQYEKPRTSKVRKVRLLKDEPIVLAARPPPVTEDIKRIMMKELPKENPKDTSPKAKKCGQCEMKAAAVVCQDCGENYCPGCFASFHLKGALKKHRSVPIQALGARQSPRVSFLPKPPAIYHAKKSPGNKLVETPAKVQFKGPSLLEGEYDEQRNTAEFASAVAAWRAGKGEGDQSPKSCSSSEKSLNSWSRDQSSPKQPSVNKATQSPRYTIDVKGTSTEERSNKPLKIEFHQSELSYAEKLLLRKHRRVPLEAMPIHSPKPSPRIVGGFEVSDIAGNKEPIWSVDFQSLYQVARHSPINTSRHADITVTPQIEVEDVSSMTDVSAIEQVTSYQVEEEPGVIEFVNEKNARNEQISRKSKKDRRNNSDIRKTSFDGKVTPEVRRSSVDGKNTPDIRKSTNDGKQTPELRKLSVKSKTSPLKSARNSVNQQLITNSNLRRTWDKDPSMSLEKIPKLDSSKNQKSHFEAGKTKPVLDKTEVITRKSVQATASTCEGMKLDLEKESSDVTKRKASCPSMPSSRSTAATPRSARSNSRQARAVLRETFGKGVLTKKPSTALSAVAQRKSSETEIYRDLGDILTLGVNQVEHERVIVARTPRSPKSENRSQSVSYKLYALGPKSWRPESALSKGLPDDYPPFGHDYNLVLSDPVAEVDDDVTQEIKALDVIGGFVLNFNFVSKENSQSKFDEPSDRFDQSQSQDSLHFNQLVRESAQSDSSSDETLQRLADSDSPIHGTEEAGRLSRMIVVDGDDMTEYDNDKYINPNIEPGLEDANSLQQLEWELASMTGRVTAEGEISRLSPHSSQDSAVSSTSSSQNMDSAREIDLALRNDGFDEPESQIADAMEVRALQ